MMIVNEESANSLEALVALAHVASDAVLADLRATTDKCPSVVVDAWLGSGVRIVIDGGYTAPSMFSRDRASALVEVAGYFQEQLAQHLGCWPECAIHDAGLYPEVSDGVAVWRCHRGDHTLSRVGELV